MAELTSDLNPAQLAAVEHRVTPLLIVAGAGSGKTRVLTRRIAHLLATGDAQPSEILAITFTNKAAGEMKERVAEIVGSSSRAMWVSTFHSACVRILRIEAGRLGVSRTFTIYDQADSLRLMTMVIRELDLDPKRYSPRAFLAQVSNLKNELIDYEQFAQQASNHMEQTLAEAYRDYQRRLQRANAFDFDDLISATVALLQLFPDVAEHYRRRFRQILVDEYQDTNHAQYVLIKELVGPGTADLSPGELCVVGDADQSIYAFRGATIRNIEEFERDYPNARTIVLEQNYRSTQTILTAANAVISRNGSRRAKNLWTDAGAGPAIIGYVADDEHDEASFVSNEIKRLRDEEGLKSSDVAVFYRTNAQSRSVEDIFIRVGMPYRVVGGVRFYERREVRDAVAYLRTLANPTDEVSLRRILNVPKRGIGERAEAMVDAFAQRAGISFAAALDRASEAPGIATRSLSSIETFTLMLSDLRTIVESGADAAMVLQAVLEQSGYLTELQGSADPQDETRVENLAELESVAQEFANENPEGTLTDFLERVSLVADADEIPDRDELGRLYRRDGPAGRTHQRQAGRHRVPHHRQHGARAVEGARQIAVDHELGTRRRQLGPLALEDVEAGVVHQDVAALVLLLDRLRDLGDGRGLHQVARQYVGLAARLLDRGRRLLQRRLAAAGQDHGRTLFRERNRRRLANTRASTGHPGDLARQRSHRFLLNA